jgi:RNA polymerase sporulation-specific sigma factor
MKMSFTQYPKPLTKEEEKKVIEQVDKGDEEAKNILVQHNLRLVAYIANKFKADSDEMEDLISIGTFGLIKAVQSFDMHRKIKFATYASRCIRNEILMHFRKANKHKNDAYLEESVSRDGEGNEMSLMETLGTEKEMVEKNIMKELDLSILYALLNDLPETEREVLSLRYGIGKKALKQSEVAEVLNISQSYVSRIEKKVIEKMKKQYELVI